MPDENLSSFNFTMFCFLSIIMSHNVRRIKNVDSCLRLAFFFISIESSMRTARCASKEKSITKVLAALT